MIAGAAQDFAIIAKNNFIIRPFFGIILLMNPVRSSIKLYYIKIKSKRNRLTAYFSINFGLL